jgi:hypothetical protein
VGTPRGARSRSERCGDAALRGASVTDPAHAGAAGSIPIEPTARASNLSSVARALWRPDTGVERGSYLLIFVTWPAPTVRPPSRMANWRPSSMAMGWISWTDISVLSPGITISVPSGSVTTPVTSVVRK